MSMRCSLGVVNVERLITAEKSPPDLEGGWVKPFIVVGCLDVQSSISCGGVAQAGRDARGTDSRRCEAPNLTTLRIG